MLYLMETKISSPFIIHLYFKYYIVFREIIGNSIQHTKKEYHVNSLLVLQKYTSAAYVKQ